MSGKRAIDELVDQVSCLPAPVNYFSGRQQERLSLVDNLILFARRTRSELQEQTFESRPHHRFVFVCPLRVGGMVSIDGNVHALPEKSGMLIFPYQFHQWIEVEAEEILWLFITFEHPDPDQLLPLRNVRLSITDGLARALRKLVEDYYRASSPSANNELILRATLLFSQILAAHHRGAQDSWQAPLRDGKGKALLERVQDVLQDRKSNVPRAPELAACVGLSESRLRTIFKQHVGVSLGSYLRNYQVHRAIALMKDPKVTVAEIAERTGFSCAGSFSRAFKAHTGATPSEFRERMPGR